MEEYIRGNKEAWEEAFEMRDASWGADLDQRIQSEEYAFFNQDMIETLKKYDMEGKTIGQFCCNNGRELMSLVKTTKAAEGIGFDIAENMVAFANEKAKQLQLPCEFVAANILDIDDSFKERFDVALITIGALSWFKDLHEFFAVISKCIKKDGIILINEKHPFANMLAVDGDDEFDETHPMNCVFSYFAHEWTGNEGMGYMTGRSYHSKTFTDYTQSFSEMIGAICSNHCVITNMKEFDYDISDGFTQLDHRGIPLSMILEARKCF